MTTLDTLLTAYAASPTKANMDAIAALFAQVQQPIITPKQIAEIKILMMWPVTENDARTAIDMLQSLHFDLSMAQDASQSPEAAGGASCLCGKCDWRDYYTGPIATHKICAACNFKVWAAHPTPVPSAEQQTALHPGRQSNLEDAIERASTEMQEFDTKGSS